MTALPLELLACPRCDRPLRATDANANANASENVDTDADTDANAHADTLECTSCRTRFPALDGVPWLFAEPDAARGEWRGRLHFQITQLKRDAERLAESLARKDLSATTRRRLEHVRAATADHAARLESLLAPLAVESATASHETHLALRTRPPPDQGLATYYANLHRDWSWGDTENAASLECVTSAAGERTFGRTLVLGAGAGRLAYDLHAATDAELTVALDFNPLLVLAAARIARGETLELHEFPIAPRRLEDTTVLRELSAPQPARPGLEFVLGDAHRPPFARGAFDTVVTPWLVDILPEPFETLAARVNTLLGAGGRWINFGSLNFHAPDPAERLSVDECVEAVAGAGFDAPAVDERELPYMCSPASRHGRREHVVTWSAAKRRAVRKVPRHEALPDWIVRGREPVPLLDAFRAQAMSTRIHAYIMSLIDGRRSLDDIAGVLVEQQLMTRDEAAPAIRSFLIRMYDDSRRSGTY